jgi:hypothetical protein
MPVSPVTVKVTWTDGSTSTYVVAEADVPNIVKGEIFVSLKGKKDGESTAKDYEITRANTKDISYS